MKRIDADESPPLGEPSPLTEGPISEQPQTIPEADRLYKLTDARTITIVSAFCLCVFLTAFDAVTIGNTLPAITRDLHSTGNSYVWVGSAYNMAWASLLLTWAKISDIFGRKPVVLLGAAIFIIGSIVAATSHTMAALIAGRTVQGLGAGALLVIVGICATDMFTLRERAVFYACTGASTALGGVVGPLIGGALAESSTGGWRWIFWINLPLNGVAAGLIAIFLHLHNPRTPIVAGLKAIDWPGTILVTGAAIMLQLGLGSATVICLLAFGTGGLVLFLVYEGYVAWIPITPLRLVSDPSAVAILCVVFVHGFIYISVVYYLPLYFQYVLGATAVQSGVWLIAGTLVMPVVTIISGGLITKTGGYRSTIWTTCVFMTLSFGLFINFPDYRSWPRIILFQMLMGVGLGPIFTIPLLILQAHGRPEDVAAANSLVHFTRTLASSIGLTAGQAVLQNRFSSGLSGAGLPNEVLQALKHVSLGALSGVRNFDSAEKTQIARIFTQAFRSMWIMYAAVAAVGLIASFFVKHRELSMLHTKVETGLAMDNA